MISVENVRRTIGGSMRVACIVACLAAAQVPAADDSLATRLDAVVRSMMPAWVLEPPAPLSQSGATFQWRTRPCELGCGLVVVIRTYDTGEEAERALQNSIRLLPVGSRELRGVGDHAYHAVYNPRDAPPWMGTVYARVDTRLLTVSGAKDGADVRSLAGALAVELRKAKR